MIKFCSVPSVHIVCTYARVCVCAALQVTVDRYWCWCWSYFFIVALSSDGPVVGFGNDNQKNQKKGTTATEKRDKVLPCSAICWYVIRNALL